VSRIHTSLQGLDERAGGVGLREIAENVAIGERNLPIEQLVLDEGLDLAKEHVEAADQMQVAHDRPGEVADDALVIRLKQRVHDGNVAGKATVDVAELYLSLLLLGELFQCHALVGKHTNVEIIQVLVLAIDPRHQDWQGDVESLDLVAILVLIDLDHQR
jgi:hypothetical protein